MTENDPDNSRRAGWKPTLLAWMAVALILGSTYAFIPGIAPHEWAAEVVFVVAHLAAAEVIVTGHGRD